MADLIAVLVGGGTAGLIAAGALVFLLRAWITERLANSIRHEYDQRLETHKAQLAGEHETAIERLRADLQIVAFERQTKFSTLHEKAALAMADIYAALLDVFDATKKYVNPVEHASDGSKSDRRELLSQAVIALRKCYRPRAIYLPKPIAENLARIDALMVEIANRFAIKVEFRPDKTDAEAWLDLWTRLDAETEPALAELGNAFRQELGVSNSVR